METQWILRTSGDPLATVQRFLRDIWARGGLTGMLVPYRSPNTSAITLRLAQESRHFDNVDPFAPVMLDNAAETVVELARQHSTDHYGAMLRPCDARGVRLLDALFLDDEVVGEGLGSLAGLPGRVGKEEACIPAGAGVADDLVAPAEPAPEVGQRRLPHGGAHGFTSRLGCAFSASRFSARFSLSDLAGAFLPSFFWFMPLLMTRSF